MTSYSPSKRSPFKSVAILVLILLILLALFNFLLIGPPPTIELSSNRPGLGQRPAELTARVAEPKRGLTAVRIELVQGDQAVTLVDETYASVPFWAFWRPRTEHKELAVTVSVDALPEKVAGQINIRATAGGMGTSLRHGPSTTQELPLSVHLTPPQLAVISTQNYAAQGGSGVVTYRVGESALEEGGRDGVMAGEWFFPGFPLAGGAAGERFAFFGVPYDLDDPAQIQLLTSDTFGNENRRSFLDQFFPQPLKRDTIQLSDGFLRKVVDEIFAATPELERQDDLLADYLLLNRDLRRRNAETLRQLAAKSRPERLWSGAFSQLPNSQVTSAFADRRTYVYDGEEVDRQDHLGFDVASLRRAPIPAANRGVVVLARYFGIYGNTVVLDHGYGLMTLYSHLSSIDVTDGQTVENGEVVGRTGDTGLAGGDHLHFTVLLQGLPVKPLEWWDEGWIRERVLKKLP